MNIKNDVRRNGDEQLLRDLPITLLVESDNLTYYLRLNKYGEPFIKCCMYSVLIDKTDVHSSYSIVEFTQGVELEDIANNSFLIREMLCFGIRHLAFFGGGRNYIINAIACSDYNILDELLKQNFKITDVPVKYPVKIHDIQEVQNSLLLL